MSATDPNGLLLVDKPVGPTSHDVVALARRALRTRRIGHAGTLDPFASGLLMLCVGAATRLVEYATALDKSYLAELTLGTATDTDDCTGATIAGSDAWREVTRPQLEAALAAEVGERLQLPPQYSAKKVGGERSHRIARSGGVTELEPVRVRVHAVRLLGFDPPVATIEVDCGSGTYIRAIARDVGAALGCGAHLSALRRTSIGGFRAEEAITLDRLGDGSGVPLLPPIAAVSHLPVREVDPAEARRLTMGQALPAHDAPNADAVAVVTGSRLIGIAEIRGGALRPRKMLQHE
jgi:tRNA pseudouridine55 synthase